MKKGLTACRVLIGVLIGLCVVALVGIPLISTFTTNDRAPSLAAFWGIVTELLPLLPFLLVLLLPLVAAESLLQYKLGRIDRVKFKRRMWILAVCEFLVLAATLRMLIRIADANASALSRLE